MVLRGPLYFTRFNKIDNRKRKERQLEKIYCPFTLSYERGSIKNFILYNLTRGAIYDRIAYIVLLHKNV